MKKSSQILLLLIFITLSLQLSSCTSGQEKNEEAKSSYPQDPDDARREKRGKLTGEGGLKLWGKDEDDESGSGGIGVNSFLWRATLDTLSFMPLSSVDPHGGVIITDWYEDPGVKGERFKINVLILGTKLRSDGIRLSVFRQVKDQHGEWADATVSSDTPRELEDKILTRARELRITSSKRKS